MTALRAALLLACLSSWPTLAAAAEPAVLNINYGAISAAYTPVWVAQDEGLFAKYGLTTDLKYVAAATEVQALLAGSLHIVNAGPELVDARLGGADVAYIAALVNRFVFSLYARPEVQKLADLRGRVVAATAPNSLTDFASRILIKEAGLAPGADVRMLYVKGVPEVLTSMMQGIADAGPLSPPTTLRARRAGLRELVNLTERNLPIIQAGVGTTREFLKAHPDVVRRYCQALVEAMKVVRTNPEATKRAIARYTRTTSEEDLEETYRAFAPVWARTPYVSTASIQTLLDFSQLPAAKTARPADFVDSSWLTELETSGFVDRLYR